MKTKNKRGFVYLIPLIIFIIIIITASFFLARHFGLFAVWQEEKPLELWSIEFRGSPGGHPKMGINLGSETLEWYWNNYNTYFYHNNQLVCVSVGMGSHPDNCVIKCNVDNPPDICKYYRGGITNGENNIIINHIGQTQCNVGDGTICRQIKYKLIFTENAFDFDISSPSTSYIVGENITLSVTIKNNVIPVKVKPGIEVKTPSPLGGTFTDTKEKVMVDLPMGETTFEYEITLTKSIDVLDIVPYVSVYIPGEVVIGDWFYDGRAQCHTQGPCSLGSSPPRVSFPYLYGRVAGGEVPIQISERPLYLDILCSETEFCLSGYECEKVELVSGTRNFCVRDDLKELSCYQRGCPYLEGTNLGCTTSGICAETIFVNKECTSDENCTTWFGESMNKCDVGSGLCIPEIIYNKITKCNTASDCITPCLGMTKICDEGICVYSGECDPNQYGCREVGCLEGECNEETNVCEKTIYKYKFDWIFLLKILGVLGGIILIVLGILMFGLIAILIGILIFIISILSYVLPYII
jgi:hypothetical protein